MRYLGKTMYRSEVSLVQLGDTRELTDRPTGRYYDDKVTRVELCKSRIQFIFFFFPSLALSASNVPRCARSVESVICARVHSFVACISSIVVLARCFNGVRSALYCSSTANSSERITEPSRTSSASRTAVAAPRNSTAAIMCPT